MKLLYAIAFAVFSVAAPVASPAQSLDLSLLPALCSDDYYEDTAGQCGAVSAGEVLTVEAILAKYGIIITRGTDDEVIVFYLDDLEDMPPQLNSASERRRSPNRRQIPRACQQAGYNRF